jgi:hypothetical protein
MSVYSGSGCDSIALSLNACRKYSLSWLILLLKIIKSSLSRSAISRQATISKFSEIGLVSEFLKPLPSQ